MLRPIRAGTGGWQDRGLHSRGTSESKFLGEEAADEGVRENEVDEREL